MRSVVAFSSGVFGGLVLGGVLLAGALPGCSSAPHNEGWGSLGDGGEAGAGGGDDSGGTGFPPGDDGGSLVGDGGTISHDGSITVTTKVYAHTDDSLYSMDPQTKAITLLGKFAGMSGGSLDSVVTDLAVDANDEVFVNTESVIYKAAVPSTPGGTVQLTQLAKITLQTNQRFYALTFAPAGALDPNAETLVGGDGNGEVWAIDRSTGATKDLGSFGNDPSTPGSRFALSGDIVFFDDPMTHQPTGLATIRSCAGKVCVKTNDYLAGIDMAAIKQAYASGTPAASLRSGIYGGTSSSIGSGTGYGEVFGLGIWEGTVFGFSRAQSGSSLPPQLVTISTSSGSGSMVQNNFSFTNGWSGAGVTTKVTVMVPPPPPTPQ
jgi:hypothetical protein